MISDVIIEDKQLMNAFLSRFKTLNLGYNRLVEEMVADGIKMDIKRLQRFIKYGFTKRITQKAYIWLLIRHGIEIGLTVKGSKWEDSISRGKVKQFTKEN